MSPVVSSFYRREGVFVWNRVNTKAINLQLNCKDGDVVFADSSSTPWNVFTDYPLYHIRRDVSLKRDREARCLVSCLWSNIALASGKDLVIVCRGHSRIGSYSLSSPWLH